MGGPFSVLEWLQIIALGGVMGAVGQGVRTIVGFKKLNDAASGQTVSVPDLISAERLFVPLAIGFIAGALAGASTIVDIKKVSGQQMLALVAAGYSAADFIEGFMSRISPSADVAAGERGVGVAAPNASGAADDGAIG
ncbi:MAG TPA: hypothetical protein VF574_17310 [Allosphingosinicella sp.]|jgi:small neutral amino acid transporter SnatA (MarC family)